MHKYPILLVLLFLIFSSCANRLHKNQRIYKVNQGINDEIITYKVADGVNVKIKETEDEGVEIIEKNGKTIKVTEEARKSLTGKVTDNFRQSLDINSYYLPDKDVSEYSKGYTSFSLSLQALNVTFKNRIKVVESLPQAVKDSFPSTWSSNFNPAIALGYSISRNQFNTLGNKTEVSLTLGGFLGFGTTEISDKVTRMPKYELSRTALTVNRGIYVNLGYQKWDLGYAYGWEKASGPGADSWVYQNQPFHGIIVGYDLVKLRD